MYPRKEGASSGFRPEKTLDLRGPGIPVGRRPRFGRCRAKNERPAEAERSEWKAQANYLAGSAGLSAGFSAAFSTGLAAGVATAVFAFSHRILSTR